MTIEIGRRGFITGLIAAPAVIRFAPLMPISSRFTPLYVPPQWVLADLNNPNLKQHAWPERLDPTWIDINDYDPGYVRDLVARLDQKRYWGPWA